MDWRPGADGTALRARADLYRAIRGFFLERDVLEVETPLLCQAGVTDPAIATLLVEHGDVIDDPRYLQTSPEYAMKRLLAAGSGPIYQIARAFRDGESGHRHNPEFTLLEWYRPGFDQQRLMDETAALVTHCLGARPRSDSSYRELFVEVLGLDPFLASLGELEAKAREHLDVGGLCGDRDLWLDLMMSHLIEPHLADRGLCFVFDYPPSQAALAAVAEVDDVSVARRFELYVDGVELANGYFELTDPVEQRARFAADNARRREHGLKQHAPDERLLAALEQGLPSCSGVALGVDRLLMLRLGVSDIRRVLAFDWARA